MWGWFCRPGRLARPLTKQEKIRMTLYLNTIWRNNGWHHFLRIWIWIWRSSKILSLLLPKWAWVWVPIWFQMKLLIWKINNFVKCIWEVPSGNVQSAESPVVYSKFRSCWIWSAMLFLRKLCLWLLQLKLVSFKGRLKLSKLYYRIVFKPFSNVNKSFVLKTHPNIFNENFTSPIK